MHPPQLLTPIDALAYWREHVESNPAFRPETESLLTLFLATDRRVMGQLLQSDCAPGMVLFDGRTIFRRALVLDSAGILLVHNHPNSVPLPSESDKHITSFVRCVLKFIGLEFFDNLIVTPDGQFYSFAESGWIEGERQDIERKRDESCMRALRGVFGWLGDSESHVRACVIEAANTAGVKVEEWLFHFLRESLRQHFNPTPTEDRRMAFAAAVCNQGSDVQTGAIAAARAAARGLTEFVWAEGVATLAAKFASGAGRMTAGPIGDAGPSPAALGGGSMNTFQVAARGCRLDPGNPLLPPERVPEVQANQQIARPVFEALAAPTTQPST